MEKNVTRLAVSLALAAGLSACGPETHPASSQRAADAEHNAGILVDQVATHLAATQDMLTQVRAGDVTHETCSRNASIQRKINPDDVKLAYQWATSVAYRQDQGKTYADMMLRHSHMNVMVDELSRNTQAISQVCTAKYGA